MGKLTGPEVAKHNSRKSCWIIVHGRAYDVTEFLDEHPGGAKVIYKYAGKDATKEFELIHPPDIMDKYLDRSKHLGEVDMATVQKPLEDDSEEKQRLERIKKMPSLSECFNLWDFEAVARGVMTRTGWAYYSSGADDEITMRENRAAFQRVWFRPRVLRNVEKVDSSTHMLGVKTAAPFYITATALGKLGHPDGEKCLTRAAGRHGIIQMIPTLASCSFDEIVDAAIDGQTQWLQLYVNVNRDITRKIVQHAEKRGCKGLFITVDAPMLGRREKDMRTKFLDDGADLQEQSGENMDRTQGAARAISSFIDPSLSWADLPWFKTITKMPIVVKGIQRVDDLLHVADAGLQGAVISNHGGRQLDTAPSAIEILAEAGPELRKRGLLFRNRTRGGIDRKDQSRMFDIFIDGGVRRASDIVKALCLGATGVGIGRPFLYAMSAYGEAGVSRAIELLKDELEMNMRLIGVVAVDEMEPDLVDARGVLAGHGGYVPADNLSSRVYQPLQGPREKPAKL